MLKHGVSRLFYCRRPMQGKGEGPTLSIRPLESNLIVWGARGLKYDIVVANDVALPPTANLYIASIGVNWCCSVSTRVFVLCCIVAGTVGEASLEDPVV